MSSTAAEISARIPGPVKRALAYLRNALAVVGVLLLIAAFSILSKGNDMTRDMDERARRALGDLVFKVQEGDIASALLIRAFLAPGARPSDAEKAIRQRAKDIGLTVVQTQKFSFSDPAGESKREIMLMGFCEKKTLEELLLLRPELGALLPCTILLVAEPEGQMWVATLNMELLIYGGQARDAELEIKLLSLKDRLLDLMAAAVAAPGKAPEKS